MKKLLLIIALVPTIGLIGMENGTKKLRVTTNQIETVDQWLDETYTYVEKLEERQNDHTLKHLEKGVQHLIGIGNELDKINRPDRTSELEYKWVEILNSLKTGFGNLTEENAKNAHRTAGWLLDSLDQLSALNKENMTPKQYSRMYEVLSKLSESITDKLSLYTNVNAVIKSLNTFLEGLQPAEK